MPANTSHALTTAGIRRAIWEGRDPKHYKGKLEKKHLAKNKQGKIVSAAKQRNAKKNQGLKNFNKFKEKLKKENPAVGTIHKSKKPNGDVETYKVIATSPMLILKKA